MNEDLPNLNCDICGKRLTKADFPSHMRNILKSQEKSTFASLVIQGFTSYQHD
jgi:hypothetical protein